MELVERGHNVTALSDYKETTSAPNLHYIHLEKVHDHIYNSNSNDFNSNLFDIGNLNGWQQLNSFHDFGLLSCEGAILSNGWQQLQNYPDDFKV